MVDSTDNFIGKPQKISCHQPEQGRPPRLLNYEAGFAVDPFICKQTITIFSSHNLTGVLNLSQQYSTMPKGDTNRLGHHWTDESTLWISSCFFHLHPEGRVRVGDAHLEEQHHQQL